MSPLKRGPNTIRQNVTELMSGIQSPARRKAIMTIAKRYNISPKEAQLRQALAISKSQARK